MIFVDVPHLKRYLYVKTENDIDKLPEGIRLCLDVNIVIE